MATKRRLFPVPYIPGNGTGQMILYVRYIADFPRDMDGWCAFCHGDCCADRSPEDSHIWKYMNTPYAPGWPLPQVCPLCDGKAP